MTYFANVSGAILCPYQILLDILQQIPDSPPGLVNLAFQPVCDLNSTNDWINLESYGKPVALRAKALADLVSPLLKKQNVIALDLEVFLDDAHLASDNLFCLIYLAELFETMTVTFVTTAGKSHLQSAITSLVNKDNISVQFRTDYLSDDIFLKLSVSRHQALRNLGFTFDETVFDNHTSGLPVNQLIGFSWICLKSGGYEIACQLLEKAQKYPGNGMAVQEQLFMHLLMIRFFSHQYALITNSEFPEDFTSLEQADITTLQFLKAYSATLSRNLSVANEFFKKCDITEQMPLSDESSLYKLNLFALSRVLQNDMDTAFALEFRIKTFIEQHGIDTIGLKYVNFINIARLYKKTKQYELSLEYYNLAYHEISNGGYTTSDHIYYNMNLGSLYEAAGDYPSALKHWIKAALHWLACTNKYELSWRPRLVLTQEKLADISTPMPVDKAHTFLLDKIRSLITLCGLDIPCNTVSHHQFRDDTTHIRKEICFISNNMIFFTGKSKAENIGYKPSLAEEALSTKVSEYLHCLLNIPDDQDVFVINSQMDAFFPSIEEEALAFSKLSDCALCNYNGRWLGADDFESVKLVSASLSKVIESITQTTQGLSIGYKRSFLNKILHDQDEINLVNQLRQTERLSLSDISDTERCIVQQLAKKRILNFSFQ